MHKDPLSNGLHFKVPFFESVDMVQVSLRTLHVPEFSVNTIDNQQIKLKINFNYTVPKDKVNHLLYEVGKTGNTELDESIIPVVQDRVSRIFAVQNTTQVSQNREQIQEAVEKIVSQSVADLFGIQPHSLQIAAISYSDAFVQSNEFAVKAKNDAIAEQNKVNIETAKAAQAVAQAKGAADSKIENARGDAESQIVRAKADKEKQELDGQGQSSRLKNEIAAFGGSPQLYIDYLKAQAANKWNGQMPTVQAGNGGANLVIPMPAPATPAPGGK
jgi:regulator of protease activity HflC (stomatin/prohibitin superfamily)